MSRSPSQDAFASRDPRPSGQGGQTGSSLVEVMISTLILLVGLVGGAQMLTVSVQMHQLSRHSTDATRLAQTKIEELAKLDFATAAAVQISPAQPDPLTANIANYFDSTAGGLFTRRWRVDAGPLPTTRLLTVRVSPVTTSLQMGKAIDLTTIIRAWAPASAAGGGDDDDSSDDSSSDDSSSDDSSSDDSSSDDSSSDDSSSDDSSSDDSSSDDSSSDDSSSDDSSSDDSSSDDSSSDDSSSDDSSSDDSSSDDSSSDDSSSDDSSSDDSSSDDSSSDDSSSDDSSSDDSSSDGGD